MTTFATLTGTGVPHPSPGRAGAGVCIRHDEIFLQFDAGRGTVIRLSENKTSLHQLSAIFLTHVHSDHVIDLADVVMTRWIQQTLHPAQPLEIVCPKGTPEAFVKHMLDPFEIDIALRVEHVQKTPPKFTINSFTPSPAIQQVWTSPDNSVKVSAVAVHHEPVPDAVAYRVDTPDGAIVISGDTRVCDEVAQLATGSDILIHEACRVRAMQHSIRGTGFQSIFDYHADSVALGEMASRINIPHLVLTHLIPQPRNAEEEQKFADDVRQGGFSGKVTVGSDLNTFTLG